MTLEIAIQACLSDPTTENVWTVGRELAKRHTAGYQPRVSEIIDAAQAVGIETI